MSWGQGTRAWLWLVGWLDWPAGQLVRLRRRPPSAAGELAACAMDARLLPHMGEQHAANWGAAAPAAAHIAARRLAGRTQAPALLLSPQHSAAGYATLRLHAAVLSVAFPPVLVAVPLIIHCSVLPLRSYETMIVLRPTMADEERDQVRS